MLRTTFSPGLHWSDLEVGLLFSMRSRGLLRKRSLGQIIGFDEPYGVVHLTLLIETADSFEVAIGILPVVFSAFSKSAAVKEDRRPVGDVATDILQWRNRRQAGEVGAFSIPIQEAEKLAWLTAGTADEIGPRTHYLEYAFPLRTAGKSIYSTVEAVAVRRPKPINIDT